MTSLIGCCLCHVTLRPPLTVVLYLPFPPCKCVSPQFPDKNICHPITSGGLWRIRTLRRNAPKNRHEMKINVIRWLIGLPTLTDFAQSIAVFLRNVSSPWGKFPLSFTEKGVSFDGRAEQGEGENWWNQEIFVGWTRVKRDRKRATPKHRTQTGKLHTQIRTHGNTKFNSCTNEWVNHLPD